MSAPIETKVKAASSVTAVISALIVALLGHLFKGDVPPAVVDAVYIVVPAVAAFAAGWYARHTSRP